MKKILVVFFALLLLQQYSTTHTQAAQETAGKTSDKASIEGAVVRAGTGEALRGIHVTLIKPSGPSGPAVPGVSHAPAALPSTDTDAEGRFLLKGLEEGTYRLSFSGRGFVRQELGQRISPGEGRPIQLTGGQSMKDIAIQMLPAATVSGRIVDSDRRPAPAIPVQLARFAYDANGVRTLQPVSATQTDDRGEYRLFYLTPGRYYFAAGVPQAGVAGRQYGTPASHPMTYYPGSIELSGAAAIDIHPAEELRIDLSLARPDWHRIRGTVVDSRTGKPPSSVIMVLTRDETGGRSYSYEVRDNAISYNPADGAFELRNVSPGLYTLSATWGDSVSIPNSLLPAFGGSASPPPRGGSPVDTAAALAAARRGGDPAMVAKAGIAIAQVSVADRDVENVSMAIIGGGTLKLRLTFDEAVTDSAVAEKVKVRLKSPQGSANTRQTAYAVPDGDGTMLQIQNITPGQYRPAIEGLPPDFYIKTARLGGMEALDHPMELRGTTADVLEMTIGFGAGSIEGLVSNDRSEPVPGAQVLLVPYRNRDRQDLFRAGTADGQGRFTFSAVAPGDYRVFSWESIEPFAYFDPDLLAKAETRSQVVHMTTSRESVQIKAVP